MPDTTLFFHGRLFTQPLPIDGAFPGVRIHREVSDLKCSQIWEEVASLRWGHAKIAEARFHNSARSRDFVPLHRNTQPGIIRSPASDTDKQVGTVLRVQRGVEIGDALRYFVTPAAFETLRIDDNDVV